MDVNTIHLSKYMIKSKLKIEIIIYISDLRIRSDTQMPDVSIQSKAGSKKTHRFER